MDPRNFLNPTEIYMFMNLTYDSSVENAEGLRKIVQGTFLANGYDTNGDGVVNAQDALNAVDAWLRKGDAPTDDQILTLNVNSDGRINTFDALGIVEKFVDGSDFGVVTKAATITTNQ